MRKHKRRYRNRLALNRRTKVVRSVRDGYAAGRFAGKRAATAVSRGNEPASTGEDPSTQSARRGMTTRLGRGKTLQRELSKGNAVLEKTQGSQAFNAYDRPHRDLREFITRAERAGEVVSIKGADWKLEMGTLAEIVNHARPEPPAILFEDVPDYPKGMRLLSGATNSSQRLAIALGLPIPDHPLDVVRAYRERMKPHRPIAPQTVPTRPALHNIERDGKVDLFKFPVPLLHGHDVGRYCGTDDLVIMRDLDADWVNGGDYHPAANEHSDCSL